MDEASGLEIMFLFLGTSHAERIYYTFCHAALEHAYLRQHLHLLATIQQKQYCTVIRKVSKFSTVSAL